MTNENEADVVNCYYLRRKEKSLILLKDELTCKVDHILYNEWDPIGVRQFIGYDCFDEYHSYLPEIVEMLRGNASAQEISRQLMEIERGIYGRHINIRRCEVSAVILVQYGPYAAEHPFVFYISTDTPQAAYQSVLDLVMQTRLDAYEKRWDAVCYGYEKAIQLCHAFLPQKSILVGTCLNNLAQAYTITGKINQARMALEESVSKLEPKKYKGKLIRKDAHNLQLYERCLINLINHLEYKGDRGAAVRYSKVLLAHSIKSNGKQFLHEARGRLRRVIFRENILPYLECSRLSVEQDGSNMIIGTVLID